jgi:hypothetical protein
MIVQKGFQVIVSNTSTHCVIDIIKVHSLVYHLTTPTFKRYILKYFARQLIIYKYISYTKY